MYSFAECKEVQINEKYPFVFRYKNHSRAVGTIRKEKVHFAPINKKSIGRVAPDLQILASELFSLGVKPKNLPKEDITFLFSPNGYYLFDF